MTLECKININVRYIVNIRIHDKWRIKMISLIVAVTKNNVIGNNGIIPWKIKGEQKRFKDLTIGKTIIIGRKSFQEIGKPLPGRRTILISTTEQIHTDNCITVGSLQEAFDLTKGEDEVFVAGGGQVYKDAMPYADRIYLTVIDQTMEGSVYFPTISGLEFRKSYEERIEGEIPYTYYTYERIKQ
jgi:dihydrofolate reductase/dihydrofolate reductase (trimethoprim resistance protein)